MFFRARRHKPGGKSPRVADNSDAGTDDTTLRQSQQLMEWRRSAQRVTRAWNAWLSRSRARSPRLHCAFAVALADEERAAMEIERMIGFADPGRCVTTAGPRNSAVEAP